jgi:hypothetical protein
LINFSRSGDEVPWRWRWIIIKPNNTVAAPALTRSSRRSKRLPLLTPLLWISFPCSIIFLVLFLYPGDSRSVFVIVFDLALHLFIVVESTSMEGASSVPIDVDPPDASFALMEVSASGKSHHFSVPEGAKSRTDGRKKFTTEQTKEMEALFQRDTHPARDERTQLAERFNVYVPAFLMIQHATNEWIDFMFGPIGVFNPPGQRSLSAYGSRIDGKQCAVIKWV